MPRLCTICSHGDPAAIFEALVASQLYRRIVVHFETSDAALGAS